ncbi:hypothetical protein pEaSNUABM37_00108 [Erwinia phage pEa_SNUABM_37]|nr:hypothetical protein pEaSNUABM37_00108 [Erwinia phage pEa_SNUABM_37]QXO10578.1 hypothetical protein pEaSNUABM48_00108 [Erwinia phage pEa_SNUABM_48]
MSITLNWNNRGQTVTAVKIYRGTSRMVASTLLTTINSAAITYTDDTAANDTLYYYKVALVINGEEVSGSLRPMVAFTNLGPGPTTLISGTAEFGYFGKMTPLEFFTGSGLRSAVGTAPQYWTSYTTEITWWRKYAYFGKILYVPDLPIYTTASANNSAISALYTAGMLYGHGKTDKNSIITVAATVQNKKVVKDSYEFLIKAPSANIYTDPTTSFMNLTPSLDYYQSEGFLLSAPASTYSYSSIASGLAFPRVTPADTYGATLGGMVTQHMVTASTFNVHYNYTASRANLNWTATNTIYYLPILQLVP